MKLFIVLNLNKITKEKYKEKWNVKCDTTHAKYCLFFYNLTKLFECIVSITSIRDIKIRLTLNYNKTWLNYFTLTTLHSDFMFPSIDR